MATTMRKMMEDEFLSTIRMGQEIALDALKPMVEAVHYVIPAMPVVRVPLAGRMPTRAESGHRSPSPAWGSGSHLGDPVAGHIKRLREQ